MNLTTTKGSKQMAKRAARILEDVRQEEEVAVAAKIETPMTADGKKNVVDMSMEQIEGYGWKNKSESIRGLYGLGYSRSAIAKFLDVRYQHVRNVLITPLKKVPTAAPVVKPAE